MNITYYGNNQVWGSAAEKLLQELTCTGAGYSFKLRFFSKTYRAIMVYNWGGIIRYWTQDFYCHCSLFVKPEIQGYLHDTWILSLLTIPMVLWNKFQIDSWYKILWWAFSLPICDMLRIHAKSLKHRYVDESTKILTLQKFHLSCHYRNSLIMLYFKWIS